MPGCTVLSDRNVNDILLSLSKSDITKFRNAIASTLISYSTSSERQHQPDPGVVVRPSGHKTLFRTFTSPDSVGVKIIVSSHKPRMPLHGILALCDEDGLPTGFINAEEVTGYRTTLSAMILYGYRRETGNVVVFGAGKQALWHIRLALALRGSDVKKVTVVNRNVDRAGQLVQQIREEQGTLWKEGAGAEVGFVDVAGEGYDAELKALLEEADVVFCTTPSKEALFPAKYLTGKTGRKGCYVSTIGSWTADMLELDPELLRDAAELSQQYSPKGNDRWGVVVDDRHECFKNSGEVIQSKLEEGQVAEVGEALELEEKSSGQEKENLRKWLEEGFVVYKSVGVSVTDLTAGNFLLATAKERGFGLDVPDF